MNTERTFIKVIGDEHTLLRMGGHITTYSYHAWCHGSVAENDYEYRKKLFVGDEYWEFSFKRPEDALAFTLAFTDYILKPEWFE